MAEILITGASGIVGKALYKALIQRGHAVKTLSVGISNKAKHEFAFKWDIKNSIIDEKALDGTEIIVHLAGANIGAQRWTAAYKKEILDSRVHAANLLFSHIIKQKTPLKRFISMSGTGFYPDPSAQPLTESSKKGNTFLSEICYEWEKAALQFKSAHAAVTILRCAPIISPIGGILEAFTKTSKFRLIPTIGSAQNMLSWIHLKDVVNFLVASIETGNYNGIFNMASPNPVSQIEFVKALDLATGKKHLHPNVPAFALKMMLGERAALALTNQIIIPERLQEMNYEFSFPEIQDALKHCLL